MFENTVSGTNMPYIVRPDNFTGGGQWIRIAESNTKTEYIYE